MWLTLSPPGRCQPGRVQWPAGVGRRRLQGRNSRWERRPRLCLARRSSREPANRETVLSGVRTLRSRHDQRVSNRPSLAQQKKAYSYASPVGRVSQFDHQMYPNPRNRSSIIRCSFSSSRRASSRVSSFSTNVSSSSTPRNRPQNLVSAAWQRSSGKCTSRVGSIILLLCLPLATCPSPLTTQRGQLRDRHHPSPKETRYL